jgi:heat shock protein HslJ
VEIIFFIITKILKLKDITLKDITFASILKIQKTMKNLKWIVAVAVIALMVGCCNCRTQKSARIPLTGTEWKLSQLYGATINSDNYRVTFSADGQLAGIGDCNRFTGSYTLNAGALKVADNLVSTRMMCLNQAQEDKFLGMLRAADAYYIDGVRLVLIHNGEVIALLDPYRNEE